MIPLALMAAVQTASALTAFVEGCGVAVSVYGIVKGSKVVSRRKR